MAIAMNPDLDPGRHYDQQEPRHPHLPHCARCGAALVDEDGLDTNGGYCCEDYHGHDEDGVFAPAHAFTLEGCVAQDDEFFIVHDKGDSCYFDQDSDEWIAPSNPFIGRSRRIGG